MTHGKTYKKSPRRINHKATKSKTNTGTTALERSVEQTTAGFKAPLQLANFTLGPDATLNTEIHKNSVRIKAPNSVNASKRKHKNQINHYNKQRRVLMANSTVCQSKWKPIVEPRRAKPKTYRRLVSHGYLSLFIIVINLIFMFSLWCSDCEPIFFMYFCIKSSIGTQGEVASCKHALNPRCFNLLTVLRLWSRC